MRLRSVVLLFGVTAVAVPFVHAVSIIHDYTFSDSLIDSLGGPALVATPDDGNNVGSVGAGFFSFGQGQGLLLSGGLPNAGAYTVALRFAFTDVSGYRRIIDFQDDEFDQGLYELNSGIDFFPVQNAGVLFSSNTYATVVATRTAAGVFTAYVNGVQEPTFTDSGNLAVFTDGSDAGSAGDPVLSNPIQFFRDDEACCRLGEASAGAVTQVEIFDDALTAGQAAASTLLRNRHPQFRNPLRSCCWARACSVWAASSASSRVSLVSGLALPLR